MVKKSKKPDFFQMYVLGFLVLGIIITILAVGQIVINVVTTYPPSFVTLAIVCIGGLLVVGRILIETQRRG